MTELDLTDRETKKGPAQGRVGNGKPILPTQGLEAAKISPRGTCASMDRVREAGRLRCQASPASVDKVFLLISIPSDVQKSLLANRALDLKLHDAAPYSRTCSWRSRCVSISDHFKAWHLAKESADSLHLIGVDIKLGEKANAVVCNG